MLKLCSCGVGHLGLPFNKKNKLINRVILETFLPSNIVSDLQQVGGFLHQNWLTWYNWNIVESDVKHHNPNPFHLWLQRILPDQDEESVFTKL
jgi:hypothetical protein